MAENKIVPITQKGGVANGAVKIDNQFTSNEDFQGGRLELKGQRFIILPCDKIPSRCKKSYGGFTPNGILYDVLARQRHPYTKLYPITTIGRDEARSFKAYWDQIGVSSDLILECGEQTGVSYIIYDPMSEDRVIIDAEGDNSLINLEEDQLEGLFERIATLNWLISGHLRDTSARILNEFLALSHQIPVGINPGRTERDLVLKNQVNLKTAELFYVQLNRDEAMSMSRRHSVQDVALLDEMERTFHAHWLVMTKGADGVAIRNTSTGRTIRQPAYALNGGETATGVGDLTAVTLMLDLLNGISIDEAIDWAQAVAGSFCEKRRLPDSEEELRQWMRLHELRKAA